MRKLLLILTSIILTVSINAQTNLITNPSFETGDLTGWRGYNNGVQQADAYHGTWAGRIDHNKDGSLVQFTDLIPGNTYSVSFFAKWPEGTGDVNGISLTVQDRDKSNAKFAITPVLSDTLWTMADTVFTVPPKTGRTRIVIYKGKSPRCFIDTVTLIDLGAIKPAVLIDNDGEILEGSEDGEVLTVSMINDVFAASLTAANWSLSDLPTGVSIGSVDRVNDTAVTITLTGNAAEDYDNNISSIITISGTEFVTYNEDVYGGYPVNIKAIVEPAPAISLVASGDILEDFEDGTVISVEMDDDTFVDPITPANWTTNNFPEGVTIGSVERVNDTNVVVTLSGNTTGDYDLDITNAGITIAVNEFATWNEAVDVNTLTFVATVEGEELLVWEQNFDTIPDGTNLLDSIGRIEYGFFDWERPDSAMIRGGEGKLYLSGQNNYLHKPVQLEPGKTYVYKIDLATSNGSGVTAQVHDRTTDVKQSFSTSLNPAPLPMQNVSVLFSVPSNVDTVWLSIYKWGGSAVQVHFDNMQLYKLTEPMISASSDGEIVEGAEDGEVITVSLSNDALVASPDMANWSISNLPAGVSIGSVSRVDDVTLEITLSGNATDDYDTDITGIVVSGTRDEFVTSNKNLSTETTIAFTAIVEPPAISLADDGEIIEGAEDGEVITVSLTLGVFVDPLTPANWTVTNLPEGVTVGEVFRVDSVTVEIVLSGNTTEDYQTDITDLTVSIAAAEIKDWGSDIIANSGVTFSAQISGITEGRIEGLRAYPNPVGDEFTIAAHNEIIQIEVSNILGESLLTMKNYLSEINSINTSNWTSGLYLIKVTDVTGNQGILRVIK